MAKRKGPTRDEILIGFQVVKAINIGNHVTHNAASYLSNEDPKSGKELLGWTEQADGGRPIPRKATADDVKIYTEATAKIIDVEVKTRLKNFLDRFNDNAAVNKGLAHFAVSRRAVDRDIDEVVLHQGSARFATEVIHDLPGLKANGDLLSLYSEDVAEYVRVENSFSQESRMLVAYQDVMNAISLELKGICSYNGGEKFKRFEDRKAIILARLRAAAKIWEMSDLAAMGQDVVRFHQAQKYAQTALRDATTVSDLSALGDYVGTRVPQLPLIRRWWNVK